MSQPYDNNARASTLPWDSSHPFACMLWVHDNVRPESAPGASAAVQKAVIGHIARRANADGTNAWPSYADIADATGLGRSSIIRGVAALEAAGLIERTGEVSTGRGRPVTIWRITGKGPTVGRLKVPNQGSKGARMEPFKGSIEEPKVPSEGLKVPDRAYKGTRVEHDRPLTVPDRPIAPQPPAGGPSPETPECVNSVDPWKAAEERFTQHGFRDECPDPDATRFGFHTESEEPDRSELPTVGERFEAKSEVRASQAADNAGPAPHLTGNERGDSAAVLRWWVSMAPLGQVGGTDMARMKQAIAAQGPALVLKALASMRGRGVHYPQLRAVGQWIRTDRAETIRAERQIAHARREATRPVVKKLRALN